MVVIRLSRYGTKKRPFYYVTVTNSRNARDGRFIERVGFYNPIAKGGEVKLQLNQERITYWISKGAVPSERVSHLIDNFAEIAMKKPEDQAVKEKEAKEEKKENKIENSKVEIKNKQEEKIDVDASKQEEKEKKEVKKEEVAPEKKEEKKEVKAKEGEEEVEKPEDKKD